MRRLVHGLVGDSAASATDHRVACHRHAPWCAAAAAGVIMTMAGCSSSRTAAGLAGSEASERRGASGGDARFERRSTGEGCTVARCDSRQRRGLAAERVLGGKGRLMHRHVKPRRQLLISNLIVGAA